MLHIGTQKYQQFIDAHINQQPHRNIDQGSEGLSRVGEKDWPRFRGETPLKLWPARPWQSPT